MILRSLARRPQAVHSLASVSQRCTTAAPFLSSRSLHHVPTLANHVDLQQNGISRLFTPKGFQVAYTDYQQYMIDDLNLLTSGTPFEDQDPKSLVIEFARDPMKAYPFNVASMAFNNHFFFRGINTNPDSQSMPSSDLMAHINKAFSSFDTFRETFLGTAEAMFGPGFVWLVQTAETQYGEFRILPTYLAGSPLSGAHYRRQSHDLNTHNAESYQELNKVGTFGASSAQEVKPKKPLGGVDVVPLLCVNTWQHVYLQDYGVRGKRAFLEAWWDRIDWEAVRQNATLGKRADQQYRQFQFATA